MPTAYSPLRGRDQHQRKQQPVLRLVAQQPDTNARQDRPRRHCIERAPDQRRGEKAVLPDQRIGQYYRKRHRQEQPERPTDDRAHDREIGHGTGRGPADKSRRIRKMRQQACDEQKWRRIVPGKIAGIALAEDCDLNLLLDIPIIGLRGMAIEHQAPGGPDVDKIGRDAEALVVEDPPMGEIGRREERGVDDEQHKAQIEQRDGNRCLLRNHRRGVCCGGHAASSGARNQRARLQPIGQTALKIS